MKAMKASEFKARCLAILDDVARTGEPVAISKRGRIVAEVVRPRHTKAARFPQQALRGTGKTLGDIIAPAVPPEMWEALSKIPRR
jgi:antitoxin (DNA-binding transcriptional repressor) of toxin-antitoxin stability system